jgi:hypothetical protein
MIFFLLYNKAHLPKRPLSRYNRHMLIKKWTFIVILSGIFALGLGACTPATPAPTSTPAPATDTPIPTPPTVWFPPTNTATPAPTFTASATPPGILGQGQLLLADNFDPDSPWNVARASRASAVLDRNRLVLSAYEPQTMLISTREQNLFGDFYAEIDVRLNLCAPTDEYGILFRQQSSQSYYRLTLNCAAQIRLDRVYNSQLSFLYQSAPSGDAPFGAPGEVKIGIWASGSEIRIFLNGRFQIQAFDPLFRTGGLGVFIRSASGTQTVSFGNLNVWQVTYVSPTPTVTPSNTPTPSRTPRE